jgi:hypothetical protein
MNLKAISLKPGHLTVLFMVLAVLSILAIVALPRLLLNPLVEQWDAQKVQTVVSSVLARPVQLGVVNLTLGWTGLDIKLSFLKVQAKNGAPFINCGPTVITVSAIPLLSNKVVLEKVVVDHLEMWLQRMADGTWNYEDIPALKDVEEMTELKITDGKIHLSDLRTIHLASYRSTEWQNFNLSLSHEFGTIYWPFQLSCIEAGDSPHGKLSIEGRGSGRLDRWRQAHYSVHIDAQELEPLKLAIFVGPLPEIFGRVDFKCKGSGVGAESFEGEMGVIASDVRISPPGLSPLRVRDLKTKAKIKITPTEIAWRDLKIHVGPTEFASDGALSQWTSALPQYDAHIAGDVDDLGELLKKIDAPWAVTGLKSLPESLAFKGDIDAHGAISSDPTKPKFSAFVTLKKSEFLLKEGNIRGTNLAGNLCFDRDGMQVRWLTGIFDQAKFSLTGKLVPETEVDLNLSSPEISINAVKAFLAASRLHDFAHFVESYKLKGKMQGTIANLHARVFGSTHDPRLKFNCDLEKVSFEDGHGQPLLAIHSGSARFDSAAFILSKVKGTLGKGKFDASGITSCNPKQPLSFAVESEGIEIDALKRVVDAANLDLPWLDARILAGQLEKAAAKISGTLRKPVITMQCQPKLLTYSPLGPSQAVRISDGIIVYTGDQFRVVNLTAAGQNFNLIVSAIIDDATANPTLSKLNLKNSTIDIGQLLALATAKANPENIRTFAQKTLSTLPVRNLRGQLVTNCSANFTTTPSVIKSDGTITSLEFDSDRHHVALNGGTFNSSPDGHALRLHKITGTFDNINFTARGNILSLDQDLEKCRFRLHANALLAVSDLTRVLTKQANALLKLQSQRPLDFDGKLASDGKGLHAEFLVDVPHDANLQVGTKLTNIVQPKDTPIKLRGVVDVNESELTISDGKIDLNGTAIGFSSKSNGILEDRGGGNAHFEVNINIPAGTSMQTLLAFVPSMNITDKLGEFTGVIDGLITLAGDPINPDLSANLNLSSIDIPRFKVVKMRGNLVLQSTNLATEASTPPLRLLLNAEKVTCAGVLLNELQAELLLDSTKDGVFQINIQKLAAAIAKGNLSIGGTYVANSTGDIVIDVSIKNVDANDLYTQMTGLKNEIFGVFDFNLQASAQTAVPEIRPTLVATGNFQGKDGRLSQFSALEAKLDEARILEQGVLGLSLGNLVAPLESRQNGVFQSLKGNFSIDHGLLEIKQFDFRSRELVLDVAGTADLINKKVQMVAAGNMVRFDTEGKIGKISSVISIGGLMDFVAKGTPLRVPDVPLIGGVSPAKSHDFAFQIAGNLDHPSTLSQSITKTFRWTSNHEHHADNRKQAKI